VLHEREMCDCLIGQLTIGAAAAAADRVQWDKTSVVAHQGDNVTLVCKVRSIDDFDVMRLTLTPSPNYVAAPGLPRSETESARQRWTIADNDFVKPPFLALPRYGVTMTIDGRRAAIRLQLIGAHSICFCPPNSHGSTIYHNTDVVYYL